MSGSHLFCFGLGYSALILARRIAAAGWSVTGTCRSAERQGSLHASGVSAVLFDRNRPVDAIALNGVTQLLVSVPPDAAGWDAIRHSNSPGAFESFLREYPNSPYAGAARLKFNSTPGAN